MRTDIISDFRTDPALLAAIRSAPEKRSAREMFEQKVSYVYGSIDRTSRLTKEQVREMILQQAGESAGAASK